EQDGYDEDDARGRSSSTSETPRRKASTSGTPHLQPQPSSPSRRAEAAAAAAAAAAAVPSSKEGTGTGRGEGEGGGGGRGGGEETEGAGNGGGGMEAGGGAGRGVGAGTRGEGEALLLTGRRGGRSRVPPRTWKSGEVGGIHGGGDDSEDGPSPSPSRAHPQPPLPSSATYSGGEAGGDSATRLLSTRAASASPSFAPARRRLPARVELLPNVGTDSSDGDGGGGGGGSGGGGGGGSGRARRWEGTGQLYRAGRDGADYTGGVKEEGAEGGGRGEGEWQVGSLQFGTGFGRRAGWGELGGRWGEPASGWQYSGGTGGDGGGGEGGDRRSTVRYDRTNMLPITTTTTATTTKTAATASNNAKGNSSNGNANNVNGGTQTGDASGNDIGGVGGISGSGGGSGSGSGGGGGGGDGGGGVGNGRPSWMRSVIDKNGQGLGLASSLVAAAMETNAQFVFKGTMRGGCAFLAILSLFLASCQIISFLQKEHEWYPNLIKYSITESKQLVVDNAFVVKATLETEGDPVIVAPRH
ncbi:unnamed protein product, partial [Laminaria digitata]